MPGILERDRRGDLISLADPDYPRIAALIAEAQQIIAEMNTGYRDPAAMRALFGRLTGAAVDESFWLMQPFYTDFGKNIRVGRNVFVNHACEFMNRGGITLEDDVLIGPRVNLVTISHPTAGAFGQLLPLTLDMPDLNSNEKHAPLPRSLPSNPARAGTIRTGDVLLYGNQTLVVFYKTFESGYSYTRIGRVTESAGLAEALGPGSQRITFAMQ